MKSLLGILESKTMWINALSLVAVYGGNLPVNKYTVAGLAVANLALRLLTKKPIVFVDAPPSA